MKESKFDESRKRFPQLLREALVTSFTWNLVAVVAITAVIYWLRGSERDSSFIGSELTFTQFVVVVLFVLLLNAIVSAIYTYARVRNPRYIAKQQAYERKQAERIATPPSVDKTGTTGKSDYEKTT
ncbi:MAG: hypothetical protein ACOY95_04220 [Pseudomonadota bacterium]